jgi:proline iminopeptidase
VTINGNDLNVEVLGPEGAPLLIAHHGGAGIGSLAEPKATFGPLADEMRLVVFDARIRDFPHDVLADAGNS